MALREQVQVEVGSPLSANAPAPARLVTSFKLLQVVLLGLTVAAVVIGWRTTAPSGIAPASSVAFGLVIAWALVGLVDGRASERGQGKASPFHLLAAVDALVASVALTAGREAETAHVSDSARGIGTLAALMVTAISFHFLLALPDGRLHDLVRRVMAGAGYLAAVVLGLVFVVDQRPLSLADGAVGWTIVGVLAIAPMRSRYIRSIWPPPGADGMVRDRGDPRRHGGLGSNGAPPPGRMAGATRCGGGGSDRARAARPARRGEQENEAARQPRACPARPGGVRVLRGGLGHLPRGRARPRPRTQDHRGQRGPCPLHGRVRSRSPHFRSRAGPLSRFLATRFVYGSREAPDEVLRTFGSRLTRAIPMDELLLQLAESLRKTMSLAAAEVYTGTGEVLERTASVPDLGPASLVVSPRERPVVTRAGVSGTAGASIWLPALVKGRGSEQIRVAPVSYAGELLGLIVVERSSRASAFSEDDDRVLTDLARQVGLALHIPQLDTALQTTLDEVRKQADAPRESRARIVVSGDAERRRVERDLHDGAQHIRTRWPSISGWPRTSSSTTPKPAWRCWSSSPARSTRRFRS